MNAVAKIDRSTRTSSRRTHQPVATAPHRAKLPAAVEKAGTPRLQVVNHSAAAETQDAPRVDHDADQALVAQAQAGVQIAFELLVRKYQNRLIMLVQRLVGEADAPDVAQEAFIKAYRALPNFRGQSAFYTWLYRIAVNTAKNYLVSRSRRPATQDLDAADAEKFGHEEQMSDFNTPEACLLADEIKYTIKTVMGKLPPDLCEAITLREIEGLSYEEIAVAMRCPIGTVRSRIFRARDAIDAAVNPLLLTA